MTFFGPKAAHDLTPPFFLPNPVPPTLPPFIPSTSTDRYANVDVGVLLYHIERFPGIIILTTNLIDNIDKAFFRRLRFVLHFDIPPFKLRVKMWRVSEPHIGMRFSKTFTVR